MKSLASLYLAVQSLVLLAIVIRWAKKRFFPRFAYTTSSHPAILEGKPFIVTKYDRWTSKFVYVYSGEPTPLSPRYR